MSTEALASAHLRSPLEQLRHARQIIRLEGRALTELAARLGDDFCQAIDLLRACRGNVIVTGIGKAGLIGQKIMATLASLGTPSHFLHPAEAAHGDLGRVRREDVVLVLSQSGETEEVLRLLPALREIGAALVAITSRADSSLGRAATVTIELGTLPEAGNLGLAPTTSAIAMLAMGDALALVLGQLRDFRRDDFARLHPAGRLGWQLSKVEDHMRPLAQCRLANHSKTVREVLVGVRVPGRRTGATMLVDDAGRLSGIFTDSDLARLFETRRDDALDAPVATVMTANPLRIALGARMTEAVEILAQRKISELPVVDADGRPVGLIDITDVVGALPSDAADAPPVESQPTSHPEWRIVGRDHCKLQIANRPPEIPAVPELQIEDVEAKPPP